MSFAVLAQRNMPVSRWPVEISITQPWSEKSPALVVPIYAVIGSDTLCLSGEYSPNRHLQEGCWGDLNYLSFWDRLPVCKDRKTHINLLTLKTLEIPSKVWGWSQGKSSFLTEKQHNSCGLSDEGGWHLLQEVEWSYKEDLSWAL